MAIDQEALRRKQAEDEWFAREVARVMAKSPRGRTPTVQLAQEPRKNILQSGLKAATRVGAGVRSALVPEGRGVIGAFRAGMADPKTAPSGEDVLREWGWDKTPGPNIPLIGTPRRFVGGLLDLATDPVGLGGMALGGVLAAKAAPVLAIGGAAALAKAGLGKLAGSAGLKTAGRVLAGPARTATKLGTAAGVRAYAEGEPVAPAVARGAAGGAVVGGVLGAAGFGARKAGKLLRRKPLPAPTPQATEQQVLMLPAPKGTATPITLGPADYTVDPIGTVMPKGFGGLLPEPVAGVARTLPTTGPVPSVQFVGQRLAVRPTRTLKPKPADFVVGRTGEVTRGDFGGLLPAPREGVEYTIPKASPVPPLGMVKQTVGTRTLPRTGVEPVTEPVATTAKPLPVTKSTDVPPPPAPVPAPPKTAPPEPAPEINIQDVVNASKHSTDTDRALEQIFTKSTDAVYKTHKIPLDTAKGNNANWQINLATEARGEAKRRGIRMGSAKDADVQNFGEGKITEAELRAKWGDKVADNIIGMERWMRKTYNRLLDEVNAARPPHLQIPKREDYFRHYREMTLVDKLTASPLQVLGGLQPRLERKFLSFAQPRTTDETKVSAMGGLLNYIPSAGHAIHIDPHIPAWHKLADQVAESGLKAGKEVGNAVTWIRNYANDLAGAVNYLDAKWLPLIPGGKKTLAVATELNNRAKRNIIMLNAGSALAQAANISNGIAMGKEHSITGMGKALAAMVDKNAPVWQSGWIKERYIGRVFLQFKEDWKDKPEHLASWMIETLDRTGTVFIWNTAYAKALAENIKNPMYYADVMTRKMVGGRGIGEMPLMQKSQVFQLAFPFTLEMLNSWRVLGDLAKNKDMSGIALVMFANWVYNSAMRGLRGTGVSFDPIHAMTEVLRDEEADIPRIVGRLAGEALRELPGGGIVAGLYPEFGATIGGVELPPRREFFGANEPMRFGTAGLAGVLTGGPESIAFGLGPPMGGMQLRRTLRGLGAIEDRGIYSAEGARLRYPIEVTPSRVLQAAAFGTGALPETRKYREEAQTPLSEAQTQQFKAAVAGGANPQELYAQFMARRNIESIVREIRAIQADATLSETERVRRTEQLMARYHRALEQLR